MDQGFNQNESCEVVKCSINSSTINCTSARVVNMLHCLHVLGLFTNCASRISLASPIAQCLLMYIFFFLYPKWTFIVF